MRSSDALAAFVVGDDGRVVLEMNGWPDLELGWGRELGAARDDGELDWMLTALRARVPTLRPRIGELHAAFTRLDAAAGTMAHRLLDDDVSLLKDIQQRFEDAWPLWRVNTGTLPVVEIVGRDTLYPFEFLRAFDLKPWDDFANYAEAETAFWSFLGFSAVVRRVIPERVAVDPLVADPDVLVQVLRYDMEGTLADIGAPTSCFLVDGPPYPALDCGDRASRVIDALYDPALRLDGTRRNDRSVQVQHFACHCDTTAKHEADYFFTLGRDDDPQPCEVSLTSLRSGFYELLQQQGSREGSRPLVVMNACGSSAVDVRTAGSFPNWFLRQRHRAFVGTETEIPDLVAAAFSQRLYEELARRPLGQALVHARRRLLAEEQSPLGLLYVMYGDPDLAVESFDEKPATTAA